MPLSQSQKNAIKKWNDANYDKLARIYVLLPKEDKEKYQEWAKQCHLTLGRYIRKAVEYYHEHGTAADVESEQQARTTESCGTDSDATEPATASASIAANGATIKPESNNEVASGKTKPAEKYDPDCDNDNGCDNGDMF